MIMMTAGFSGAPGDPPTPLLFLAWTFLSPRGRPVVAKQKKNEAEKAAAEKKKETADAKAKVEKDAADAQAAEKKKAADEKKAAEVATEKKKRQDIEDAATAERQKIIEKGNYYKSRSTADVVAESRARREALLQTYVVNRRASTD